MTVIDWLIMSYSLPAVSAAAIRKAPCPVAHSPFYLARTSLLHWPGSDLRICISVSRSGLRVSFSCGLIGSGSCCPSRVLIGKRLRVHNV
jgi:hypothetical protein